MKARLFVIRIKSERRGLLSAVLDSVRRGGSGVSWERGSARGLLVIILGARWCDVGPDGGLNKMNGFVRRLDFFV